MFFNAYPRKRNFQTSLIDNVIDPVNNTTTTTTTTNNNNNNNKNI